MGEEMSHGPLLKSMEEKLDFIKEHKPKWYMGDEERLRGVDHTLDDQVHRINKKAAKPGPYKPFRPSEPDGIRAAERGR
jgi:hypothetical protein